MSRVAKSPVTVPNGVEVNIDADSVSVKGPKGQLNLALHPLV
ncbi:MAG: 50S ribosomal protein L6, partial [Acidiferrobacterales bacterium]|nr:50S ribosomal protein L6 [Acidiferrobacterales bacterium]